MIKKDKFISCAPSLIILFLPLIVFAQNYQNYLSNAIFNTPILPNADLIAIVFNAIQYILAFLGVIAVIMIILGGFLWMTAGGNDEKISKAKKVIIQAIVGMIIILLAYAIVSFVIARLQEFSQ